MSLDWDSEFNEEDSKSSNNEFTLLPDGEYTATVKEFKKDYYQPQAGSDKTPCPVADIALLVKADDGKANYWHEKFYLREDSLNFILRFFTSVGLRKHGDPKKRMPWDQIVGKTCRVKVTSREYNGKHYNKVKAWLEPKAAEYEY